MAATTCRPRAGASSPPVASPTASPDNLQEVPGAEITAVGSRSQESAEAFAQQYGARAPPDVRVARRGPGRRRRLHRQPARDAPRARAARLRRRQARAVREAADAQPARGRGDGRGGAGRRGLPHGGDVDGLPPPRPGDRGGDSARAGTASRARCTRASGSRCRRTPRPGCATPRWVRARCWTWASTR